MSKLTKKAAAFLLVLSMAFSSAGMDVLAVEGDETSVQGDESVTVEQSTGEEMNSDLQTENDQTVEAEETIVSEDNGEVEEKQRAFEYIYMDEQVVSLPGEQNIAIVFADDKLVLESATLQYCKIETGESFSVSATNIADNAVLFTQTYNDYNQIGEYQLSNITYRIVGQAEDITVDFSEQDVNASFEVVENGDAVMAISETEAAVETDVTVYSMDEEGNTVEESGTIQETVEEALVKSDTAEAMPEASLFSARSVDNQARAREKVIVICAGHDAKHTGATGNGLREEELTWKVANYCKQELEKYIGVKVYLDRNSINCAYPNKSTIECVRQRVIDADEKRGAEVFVDIHFNSVNGTSTPANGAEVYYPNNSYSEAIHQDGKKLANNILGKLTALGLTDRGIKVKNSTDGEKDKNGNKADFYTTINESKSRGMTGLIVEHAFLDNAGDAAKLKNEDFLRQLGVADAMGIVNTYGLSKDTGWRTDAQGNVSYYVKNEKVYGEQKINGLWYYFDPNTGYMVTGWHNFPAKKVYYDREGFMVKGEKKIDGAWYCFDTNSGAMITGWHNLPGKKVYYDASGKMVKGQYTIDGVQYKFDGTTGALLEEAKITGWSELNGNKVFYDSNGQLVTGEKKINGHWYCFDANTGAVITGWHKLATKQVYYNSYGHMIKGEQKINGHWYCFDANTGAMITGWYDLPTKKVYYNTDGQMLKGQQNIGGIVYNFDTRTGALIGTAEGWVDIDGKKHYYDATGQTVKGEKKIDGKWYCFDSTGVMITGWHKLATKKVFYNPDGQMVKGEKKINGHWYYFHHNTGAMTTGWFDLPTKTVYYNSAGQMLKGYQEIDGVMYNFHYNTGALIGKAVGWNTVNGQKRYYDSNGRVVKGEKKIDGNWYCFDQNTGSMITGWFNFPTKKVYYGENGAMVKGEKQINGNWYHFDQTTGALVTRAWVNNKYYSADGKRRDEVVGSLYSISGKSSTTVGQMVNFYKKNSSIAYPAEKLSVGGASTIEEFAKIFYEEAEKEGIRAEVAWTQAMLETGFLKFGGQVPIEYFNFAGIGAVDGGAKGADFSGYGKEGVRMGVRAQIQHLKAYANKEALTQECVDPRFQYVTRGCADVVENLGIKENPSGKGWATDADYGFKIRKMINKLSSF